jgi:hypothetical protein
MRVGDVRVFRIRGDTSVVGKCHVVDDVSAPTGLVLVCASSDCEHGAR